MEEAVSLVLLLLLCKTVAPFQSAFPTAFCFAQSGSLPRRHRSAVLSATLRSLRAIACCLRGLRPPPSFFSFQFCLRFALASSKEKKAVKRSRLFVPFLVNSGAGLSSLRGVGSSALPASALLERKNSVELRFFFCGAWGSLFSVWLIAPTLFAVFPLRYKTAPSLRFASFCVLLKMLLRTSFCRVCRKYFVTCLLFVKKLYRKNIPILAFFNSFPTLLWLFCAVVSKKDYLR